MDKIGCPVSCENSMYGSTTEVLAQNNGHSQLYFAMIRLVKSAVEMSQTVGCVVRMPTVETSVASREFERYSSDRLKRGRNDQAG